MFEIFFDIVDIHAQKNF